MKTESGRITQGENQSLRDNCKNLNLRNIWAFILVFWLINPTYIHRVVFGGLMQTLKEDKLALIISRIKQIDFIQVENLEILSDRFEIIFNNGRNFWEIYRAYRYPCLVDMTGFALKMRSNENDTSNPLNGIFVVIVFSPQNISIRVVRPVLKNQYLDESDCVSHVKLTLDDLQCKKDHCLQSIHEELELAIKLSM